jgi:hypothetical protein
MRKTLQLLVALGSIGLFAACDDSSSSGGSGSPVKKDTSSTGTGGVGDANHDGALLGTWKGVVKDEAYGCSYVDSVTLTISSNGTIISVDKYTETCDGDISNGVGSDTVTWSASGGKMTVVDDGVTFTSTYVVTSTTLSVTTMEDGKPHTENYVRVGSSIPEATIPSAPVFSPAGGTFATSQMVSIYGSGAGSAIRYTTDGTTPTSSSTLYAAPILVSSTRTIKAIVIKDGVSSAVSSATFTISSSTGNGESSIVGTWSAHETDSSEGMVFSIDMTATFSSNGVFVVNTKFNVNGMVQDTTQTGTWRVSGSTLTTVVGGKESVTSYVIRGNELVLKDEDSEEMVLTRVVGARIASAGSTVESELSLGAIQAWLGIDLRRLVSASVRP